MNFDRYFPRFDRPESRRLSCWLLVIPLFLNLAYGIWWHFTPGNFFITGDEPHYTLIAESIGDDGDLELSNNYDADATTHRAYPGNLDKTDTHHVVLGPHGYYPRHGIGEGILMAIPFKLGGVLGERIAMVLINALFPIFIFLLLRMMSGRHDLSMVITLLCTVWALPYTIASFQIFPDLPMGLIGLESFYLLLLIYRRQHVSQALLIGSALGLAFLPWLHFRGVAHLGIMGTAWVIMVVRHTQSRRERIAQLWPLVLLPISVAGILAFNKYAYGGALEPLHQYPLDQPMSMAIMTFLGYHFDQAQGIFFQQPLLLLGVVGLGLMMVRNRFIFAGWLFLYAVISVPFALHVPYGGFCFFGRYGWNAAPLWFVPMAFLVAECPRRVWRIVVVGGALGIVHQLIMSKKWIFHRQEIYNHEVWETNVSFYPHKLVWFLPDFYDLDHFATSIPNCLFIGATIGLFVLGIVWGLRKDPDLCTEPCEPGKQGDSSESTRPAVDQSIIDAYVVAAKAEWEKDMEKRLEMQTNRLMEMMSQKLSENRPPTPSDRPTYAYLGQGRGMAKTHLGRFIYVDTKDVGITPHLIGSGTWEPYIEKAIARLVKPGFTIVEIGANMGYHTLGMAEIMGPSGRLYAFEANPKIHALLKETISINGFNDRVVLFNKAALDKPGTIQLQVSPDHAGSGTVLIKGAWDLPHPLIDVEGIAIDSVLTDESKPIDLVRMDAEGSEPLILRGMQKCLDRSPGVVIVMEWSIENMRHRMPMNEFVEWLRGQGFKFWQIDSDSQLLPQSTEDLLKLGQSDVVICRNNLT